MTEKRKSLLIGSLLAFIVLACMGQTARIPVTTTTVTRDMLTNSTKAEVLSYLGIVGNTTNVSFITEQFTLVNTNVVTIKEAALMTNTVIKGGLFHSITNSDFTADRVLVSSSAKELASSSVTATELGYLSGKASVTEYADFDTGQFNASSGVVNIKSGVPVTNLVVRSGFSSLGSGAESFQAGTNANASGSSGIAVGNPATASGDLSISIGTVSGASGEGAIAIGYSSAATAEKALTIGHDGSATGVRSISIGNHTDVGALDSIGIGTDVNIASLTNAVGIGAFSAPNSHNEIMLGHTNQMTVIAGGFSSKVWAIQTLAAGNSIAPNGLKMRVAGSGGAVTLTSTPSIVAGIHDGQITYVQGTSDSNTLTVQDAGTLTGSTLELGSTTRVLGKGDILQLMWDSTDSKWYEVSFSNN